MTLIAPSILSADFADLGREVRRVSSADWLHVDVMDGMFVSNISIGVPVVKSLRKATDMFLDVHLMIEKPVRYIDAFADAGADLLSIHLEADMPPGIRAALDAMDKKGVKKGIVLRPITAAEAAMIKKPAILVISVGSDGLAAATRDSFIEAYKTLVTSIQSASPSTKIVCCSVTSVTPTYAGTDGLTAAIVGEANEWLKEVCTETGAYYADIGRELHASGYLMSEYASSNGKGLNNAGLNKVLEYLRVHAV